MSANAELKFRYCDTDEEQLAAAVTGGRLSREDADQILAADFEIERLPGEVVSNALGLAGFAITGEGRLLRLGEATRGDVKGTATWLEDFAARCVQEIESLRSLVAKKVASGEISEEQGLELSRSLRMFPAVSGSENN